MKLLKAEIHPKYARDYVFLDQRIDEETSQLALLPGEAIVALLRQYCRGDVFDLAAVILDYEDFQHRKGLYAWQSASEVLNRKKLKFQSVVDGEKKVFIPGEDGDVFMAPIIISIMENIGNSQTKAR
jgi:hypothetical protein